MNIADKKDIRNIELEELQEELVSCQEKKYKSKQIFEWIWKKSKTDFDSMLNISKETKKTLQKLFYFNITTIKKTYSSKDGTIKFLFNLFDGKVCEGVLIPQKKQVHRLYFFSGGV